MNGLDVAIGLAAVSAFVGGYRAGLVQRLLSWAGLVLGLVLSAQNLDAIGRWLGHDDGVHSPFLVIGALAAGATAGRFAGSIFGHWVQRRLPTRPLRTTNRLAGGTFGLAGVVAVVWLVGPLLAFVPGWPAGAARSSAIATGVANNVPVRLDTVSSVRRLLSNGRFPSVVADLAPSLSLGLPPTDAGLGATLLDEVARSVARIEAVACGVRSSGTAFAVRSDLLVTNAHVVAGADTVRASGGASSSELRVVAFDASRDLAALTPTDGTRFVPLPFGDAAVGSAVGIFGHPKGGTLQVSPGRIDASRSDEGLDIYDDRSSLRDILVLASRLRSGDSGAPIVTSLGKVVGVAFAVAPDAPSTAFALSGAELAAFLDTVGTARRGVSTDRCLR